MVVIGLDVGSGKWVAVGVGGATAVSVGLGVWEGTAVGKGTIVDVTVGLSAGAREAGIVAKTASVGTDSGARTICSVVSGITGFVAQAADSKMNQMLPKRVRTFIKTTTNLSLPRLHDGQYTLQIVCPIHVAIFWEQNGNRWVPLDI